MVIAQNKKFPPVNDLEKDSSLAQFITKLKVAAATKDIAGLVAQLDKEVSSSFDGENTIKSFIENWGVMDDTTKFWDYFSRALETGGAYVNDPNDETGRYEVVFPYVYNFEPGMEDDYYALGIITVKNVNLRAEANTSSKVVTQLTHDVVWFVYPDEAGMETRIGQNATGDPEWYYVQTYDKKQSGWVNWKYVYSTMGPRIFLFKNRAGNWKISSFVDGD